MLTVSQLSGFAAGAALEYIFTQGAATDYDLHADTVTRGWNGTSPAIIKVTLTGKIESSAVGIPAFTVIDSFPLGSHITILNTVEITGKGGAPGVAGGTGLEVLVTNGVPVNLDNTGGEINGGGGGGGPGSIGAPGPSGTLGVTEEVKVGCIIPNNCSCTGGSGGSAGGGGTGYGPDAATSATGGGAGGAPSCPGPCCACGGCTAGAPGNAGGDGGDKGLEGVSGGAAGPAIDGISKVTVLVAGTINVDQIN